MAAGGGARKYIVTAADIGRFVIIAGLGALSVITFLVAGTIVVLMAVDSSGCNCFTYFPVGLSILGLLGLFFLIDIIIEAVDAPSVFQQWYMESDNNRQLLLLLAISFVAIWLVT